ncbi:hypothetical protein FD14_GL000311 [Secundilactobacillus similis DSM 23365 = JCM 2765]|uniref:Uncharacterized protein n=1 Tax=Secundilactobacillus similis DSM 23365 = JCM 2765 TaxID=1423804 RepID=A0A0R2FAN9_9LACO|nr:hypothetical protein FD14_GL000311 [Secundilactobacillus similis DSM 23365 = JCM 2765]
MLKNRQQPPIIATQHTPGRLPPSHIAQFGTIAEHQVLDCTVGYRIATITVDLTNA